MENQNNYIAKVRDSYMPHTRTKLDELKELDKKVKLFPSVFAYIFGSVGALVLGLGMCLAMKKIGTSVMSAIVSMTVGVIIGCAGITICTVNYYIYKAMLKSRKEKYAAQIITLSNELLHEEK